MTVPAVYLDQNVFARVDALGEHDALTEWSHDNVALLLSQLHLHETLDIPDAAARNQRLELLTRVKATHAEPVRYKTGSEFLAEVRHHRPNWIRAAPILPTPLHEARQETIDVWSQARRNPDGLFKAYQELFRPGWEQAEELSLAGPEE